jgi:hypothetical protein
VIAYRRDHVSEVAACLVEIMRSKYLRSLARAPKCAAAPVAAAKLYKRISPTV